MLIARVVGEMVATQKHPSHEGPQSAAGAAAESGWVQSGRRGSRAGCHRRGHRRQSAADHRRLCGHEQRGPHAVPIDMAVIGFIDRVDLDRGE